MKLDILWRNEGVRGALLRLSSSLLLCEDDDDDIMVSLGCRTRRSCEFFCDATFLGSTFFLCEPTQPIASFSRLRMIQRNNIVFTPLEYANLRGPSKVIGFFAVYNGP